MQSEQDRYRDNGPGALRGSPERRVFVQCQMRARLIVVPRIQRKDPPQVLLAKDKHMIQAVTPDGPDQPLYIGILPGRSRCNWSIPNAHRPQTSGKDWPIGSVILAHQVRRCGIPKEMPPQAAGPAIQLSDTG